MAAESKYQGAHPRLVTKIIASYVSHHNVGPEQIPELIHSVHRTMDNLGKPAEPAGILTPAVPIRPLVQRHAGICLRIGWQRKNPRRPLNTPHRLTAAAYPRRSNTPTE